MSAICADFVDGRRGGRSQPAEALGSAPMHLRMPSIDKGVQAFIWAVVFFLFIFFGMKSIAIDGATSLIVALVSSFLIFLFVRVRGDLKDR
jgi:purine-cytosine permease-like protein